MSHEAVDYNSQNPVQLQTENSDGAAVTENTSLFKSN